MLPTTPGDLYLRGAHARIPAPRVRCHWSPVCCIVSTSFLPAWGFPFWALCFGASLGLHYFYTTLLRLGFGAISFLVPVSLVAYLPLVGVRFRLYCGTYSGVLSTLCMPPFASNGPVPSLGTCSSSLLFVAEIGLRPLAGDLALGTVGFCLPCLAVLLYCPALVLPRVLRPCLWDVFSSASSRLVVPFFDDGDTPFSEGRVMIPQGVSSWASLVPSCFCASWVLPSLFGVLLCGRCLVYLPHFFALPLPAAYLRLAGALACCPPFSFSRSALANLVAFRFMPLRLGALELSVLFCRPCMAFLLVTFALGRGLCFWLVLA